MRFEIKLEWEIRDTRNLNGGFRTGESTLTIVTSDKVKAFNTAIGFASHLPSWELTRNNINEEDYRDGNICRYYYETKLSKIIYMKVGK